MPFKDSKCRTNLSAYIHFWGQVAAEEWQTFFQAFNLENTSIKAAYFDEKMQNTKPWKVGTLIVQK